MQKNIGTYDSIARLATAILIDMLFVYQFITGGVAAFLLIVAGYYILTVIAGFCPLYVPFNFSSIKREESPAYINHQENLRHWAKA
jgi:hypothetical protein